MLEQSLMYLLPKIFQRPDALIFPKNASYFEIEADQV